MCSAAGIVLFLSKMSQAKMAAPTCSKGVRWLDHQISMKNLTDGLAKISSLGPGSVTAFFRNSNVLYNFSLPYLILIFTTHASYPKKNTCFYFGFPTSDVSGRFLGQRWPRPPSGRLQPLTVSAFWPLGGGGATAKVAKTVESLIVVGNDTVESGI